MNIFCTNCGQSLPETAQFCRACGSKQMDVSEPEIKVSSETSVQNREIPQTEKGNFKQYLTLEQVFTLGIALVGCLIGFNIGPILYLGSIIGLLGGGIVGGLIGHRLSGNASLMQTVSACISALRPHQFAICGFFTGLLLGWYVNNYITHLLNSSSWYSIGNVLTNPFAWSITGTLIGIGLSKIPKHKITSYFVGEGKADVSVSEAIRDFMTNRQSNSISRQSRRSPSILKNISSVNFTFIMLCFLLPFINVSCSNQKIGSVTGVQLMVGADQASIGEGPMKTLDRLLKKMNAPSTPPVIETPNAFGFVTAPPQPPKESRENLAIIIFALALIGLVFSATTHDISIAHNTILSALGVILMLSMKAKISNDAVSQSGGMMTIQGAEGFWLALLLFVAAALLNGYMWAQLKSQQNDRRI